MHDALKFVSHANNIAQGMIPDSVLAVTLTPFYLALLMPRRSGKTTLCVDVALRAKNPLYVTNTQAQARHIASTFQVDFPIYGLEPISDARGVKWSTYDYAIFDDLFGTQNHMKRTFINMIRSYGFTGHILEVGSHATFGKTP